MTRLVVDRSILALAVLALSVIVTEHGMAQRHRGGKFYDFVIERPNFVIHGANLSKVKVWFWPTGTGIMGPAFIGTARRISDAGRREKWILRIPRDLLSVEIFATAFDETGKTVGKKSLPHKGAGELYDALYGKK